MPDHIHQAAAQSLRATAARIRVAGRVTGQVSTDSWWRQDNQDGRCCLLIRIPPALEDEEERWAAALLAEDTLKDQAATMGAVPFALSRWSDEHTDAEVASLLEKAADALLTDQEVPSLL